MKMWILPGWQAAHDQAVFEKYDILPQNPIAQFAGVIRQAYTENKHSTKFSEGNEFTIASSGAAGYEIIINKLQHYNATFVEHMRLVPRSKFSIQLNVNSCPIHGIPEMAALLFEPDRDGLTILDNEIMHKVLVETLARLDNSLDSMSQKAFLLTFFQSGMRYEELVSLKIGDIDLKRKIIRRDNNETSS